MISLRSASGIALLLASPMAQGAEWSLAPDVTLGSDYDTNRTLSPQALASSGISGRVLVQMQERTEVLSLALTPQVDYQWYSDPLIQRTSDFALGGAANWTGELSTLSLNTRVADQSLLEAERFDTGLVNTGTRALTSTTSIGLTESASERRSWALSGGYQTQDFQGDIYTPLQNSRYGTVSASTSYSRDPQLDLQLQAGAGEFSSAAQPLSTRSLSVTAGFRFRRTERLTAALDLGVGSLSYGSSTVRSFTGNASLAYSTLLGSLSLSASRAASPSGYGVLTFQDQLIFSATRALSERAYTSFGIDVYRTSSSIGAFQINSRTYADTRVALGWHATPNWSVAGHVGADAARTPGLPLNASGASAGIEIHWTPTASFLSR